jgi:hypothetical protein
MKTYKIVLVYVEGAWVAKGIVIDQGGREFMAKVEGKDALNALAALVAKMKRDRLG